MFIGKAAKLFTQSILCTESSPVHPGPAVVAGGGLLFPLRLGTLGVAGVFQVLGHCGVGGVVVLSLSITIHLAAGLAEV